MYLFSKIVGFFLQPLAWVMLLLAVALLMQRLRGAAAGARWTWAALLLLVALGWELPPARLLQSMEQQRPRPATLPSGIAGVVVLGGVMGPGSVARAYGQVPPNEAAERITETMVLARQHPEWTVIFAGGDGRMLAASQQPESELAAQLWREHGLPAQQLRLENQSRNTAENALFAARLPGVDPQAGWLLVTSAWHMPRALAAFERAGWRAYPWPVDYNGDPDASWSDYSLKDGPRLWGIWTHEMAGRLSLWLQLRKPSR